MPDYFDLTIDGQAIDARRLECHFQRDPYPGGCRYKMIISDVDTIDYAKKEFSHSVHEQLNEAKSRRFLSYLGGIMQIKVGREQTPQYWANTIDDLKFVDGKLILTGVCSPHGGHSVNNIS